MKKLLITFALIFFWIQTAAGNDGVFYVSGNTLIPLQETEISLKSELLRFYIRDFEWMDVDVDFTFYNPGPERTLTVGFVTPPASGDIDEEKETHPQITDFTVVVNGGKLEYKVQKMKDTTFSADELEISGSDFVYFFVVKFKPGANRIQHTYRFRGGSSVETQRDFQYQITTGKRWANHQIDDFELQIHPDLGIFSVPVSFENGIPAEWLVVGKGTITKDAKPFLMDDTPMLRLAQIRDGYLSFKKKNFKPDTDISLAEYNWGAGWLSRMCKSEARCPDVDRIRTMVSYFTVAPSEHITAADLAELSGDELKIIRNFAYALRGYDFKSESLKAFYSQFFWYQPDSELSLSDIKLTEKEDVFVRKVQAAERR